MSCAQMIYELLGGNQFAIMTGANSFCGVEKGLKFRVGVGAKLGINYVCITKTDVNTFDVEYMKHRGPDTIVLMTVHKVTALQLQAEFESATGFTCKL